MSQPPLSCSRHYPARFALILAACLIGPCLAAQTGQAPEMGWTLRDLPQPGTSAWRRAAAADWSWELSVGSGGLAVRPTQAATTVRLGLPEGLLQGSSTGLVLVPRGQDGAAVPLAEGVFTALLRQSTDIYALSASPAGQTTSGRLWQVRKSGDTWKANWIVDLRESGWALTSAGPNQLWIVTQTRLYRVDLASRKIETVIDNAFWNGLRPISVVTSKGLVHVGMRGGVASIDPANKIIAWTERLSP